MLLELVLAVWAFSLPLEHKKGQPLPDGFFIVKVSPIPPTHPNYESSWTHSCPGPLPLPPPPPTMSPTGLIVALDHFHFLPRPNYESNCSRSCTGTTSTSSHTPPTMSPTGGIVRIQLVCSQPSQAPPQEEWAQSRALAMYVHQISLLTRMRLTAMGLPTASVPFTHNRVQMELLVGEEARVARRHVAAHASLEALSALRKKALPKSSQNWELLQASLFAGGLRVCPTSGTPVVNVIFLELFFLSQVLPNLQRDRHVQRPPVPRVEHDPGGARAPLLRDERKERGGPQRPPHPVPRGRADRGPPRPAGQAGLSAHLDAHSVCVCVCVCVCAFAQVRKCARVLDWVS